MVSTPSRKWDRQIIDGVPFTWIRACGYQGNSLARALNMLEFSYRAWRKKWTVNLARPDIILGSSPHPFAALAAARLASFYRVPFVLEIRDLWPYVLTEVGGYSNRHPIPVGVDKIMRYLYARADRIVMFSQQSSELMVRYGASTRKIAWIPNGVDLTMNPTPCPAPDDGQFTVTYLGAHNIWNSLDAVLDAAKILQQEGLQNVLIRFVGDGASKPKLVERAKREKIANVEFLTPVPKKDVPEVLHRSDAFVINNRADGVSRNWMSFQKVYDYLAAGRPIVFGSCSESDPVRESGAGISVPADNPREMATAIKLLSSCSSQELQTYGERGRRYIEQQYSIPVLVDRFEALAAELVGRPVSSQKVVVTK
jgi:glycosyltransferase involved in cell wall biosynthesis